MRQCDRDAIDYIFGNASIVPDVIEMIIEKAKARIFDGRRMYDGLPKHPLYRKWADAEANLYEIGILENVFPRRRIGGFGVGNDPETQLRDGVRGVMEAKGYAAKVNAAIELLSDLHLIGGVGYKVAVEGGLIQSVFDAFYEVYQLDNSVVDDNRFEMFIEDVERGARNVDRHLKKHYHYGLSLIHI